MSRVARSAPCCPCPSPEPILPPGPRRRRPVRQARRCAAPHHTASPAWHGRGWPGDRRRREPPGSPGPARRSVAAGANEGPSAERLPPRDRTSPLPRAAGSGGTCAPPRAPSRPRTLGTAAPRPSCARKATRRSERSSSRWRSPRRRFPVRGGSRRTSRGPADRPRACCATAPVRRPGDPGTGAPDRQRSPASEIRQSASECGGGPQPTPGITEAAGVHSIWWASATAWLVREPPYAFTPPASTGSARTASSSPWSATARAYGRVTLVRA